MEIKFDRKGIEVDNDMKWVAIMFIGLFAAMAIAFSVEYISESNETQSAMENGYVQEVVEVNGVEEIIWVKEK